MAILITGGAGFIGSHTAVELLNKGENIVIIDNLINSEKSVIDSIKKITNKNFPFYQLDCCKKENLEKIFIENKIEAVIHFASLKSVEESVKDPVKYYTNNLQSTLAICSTMNEFRCDRLVFSSSATVYGVSKIMPLEENFPTNPINPYGATKLIIENILKDTCNSNKSFSAVALRYFNPIGAHESGLIGEFTTKKKPSNLMPLIIKVANKELEYLSIFGNDYKTKDGTGIRDYIHVTDLARGHLNALDFLFEHKGFETFNLGTGKGYSVLEIVKTFEKINKIKIPYKFSERRAGDVPICYANPKKAENMLNFRAALNLEKMCESSWKFASKIHQSSTII